MDSKQVYDFILKVQSISKIGLIYSKDPYALTNYQELNDLSTKFLEDFLEVKFDRPNYFQRDIYPTPNISVRTIIFNEDKSKVLMVREAALQAYSLPGGWADLYDSPSQTAKNECKQEAGAEIEIVRLVGLTSRTPFKAPTSIPEYVAIFEAKLTKLNKEHEYETDDVGFFNIDNLPEISRKTSKGELLRFINAAKNGETIFD
ncbi:MAG: NUDIX hydrolase N-terminal domain-containing protein [Bacilli bacterium]|nr:NUDIX hydrolase N-terminal domain-containing protein [Bacilli bacterium]